jgi:hypothetical protein
MVKMILNVPHGFNVGLFCHIVTEIVNNSRDNCGRNWKMDYDLGDLVTWRDSQSDRDEYCLNAEWTDFEIVDAIGKLQELCPVEVHFENDGEAEPESNFGDDYYYDACYELFKSAGIKHAKHLS